MDNVTTLAAAIADAKVGQSLAAFKLTDAVIAAVTSGEDLRKIEQELVNVHYWTVGKSGRSKTWQNYVSAARDLIRGVGQVRKVKQADVTRDMVMDYLDERNDHEGTDLWNLTQCATRWGAKAQSRKAEEAKAEEVPNVGTDTDAATDEGPTHSQLDVILAAMPNLTVDELTTVLQQGEMLIASKREQAVKVAA